MEVTYTVRRSDSVWMYLGSWSARIALIPGILILVIPIGRAGSISEFLVFLGWGSLCLIGMPALLCLQLLAINQANRVIGKTVTLRIDETGVSGWPLAGDLDCSWWRIRKVHSLRGVLTLPFRNYGTRLAWVPIPDRALDPGQRMQLAALLRSEGVA